MRYGIRSDRIVTSEGVRDGYLYWEEGKILAVSETALPCDVCYDFSGHIVSPGFIETHAHGGGGADFLSGECAQVLAGCDPHDALVLTPLDQDCRCRALPYLLDLGARGVISDFSFNQQDAPGGILWNTAFTEHDNWHVNADDRDFIAFSIPPATGTMLRKAVSCGEVKLLVESDARREESTFDLVTALIPGKRKEEFWIYAHLYEPLANDNSSGVASAIETARLIMQQGNMEFSLRLILL